MKILTIGHSYVVSSNRAIVEEVASTFDVDITIAAPSFFHGDLRRISLEPAESSPCRLLSLPCHFTSRLHLFFYSGLHKLIRPDAFDLIHCWEEPYVVAGFQIARAAKNAGIPYFFWSAQNLDKNYPFPFRQFERFCVSHCAGWIAAAHLVQDTLLARGYPTHNAQVLTLAVDLRKFRPNASARHSIREQLRLTGPVVGYLGRLNEDKGIAVLLAALEKLCDRQWHFLAVGAGPYEPVIKAWAAKNGIADRVTVTICDHDDVPDYLNAMDLLVAPSQTTPRWKEQFGRMIIEAFACGIPVIGSDSGEIPRVVGQAGIVVGEKDIDGWAHAIARLLESKTTRQQLSAKGRERSASVYSSTAVAEGYYQFYQRLTAV